MHDPGVLPVRPLRRGRPGGEKTLRRRKRAAEAAAAAAADAATVLDESPESLEALTLSYLAAASGGVGAAGPKAEFAYALTRLEMTRRALRQKTRRKGKQTVTATGDLLGLAASAAAEAVGERNTTTRRTTTGGAGVSWTNTMTTRADMKTPMTMTIDNSPGWSPREGRGRSRMPSPRR